MSQKPQDLLRLYFRRSAPAAERTVRARDIEEVARKGGSVDLRHAIIEGSLSLCNATFAGSLLFLNCDFQERAHLNGSTFNSRVVVSGSRFRAGASFRGSLFKSDCRLKNARFEAGLAQFTDLIVEGLFWANRVIFGAPANFLGARFQKAAFFRATKFSCEAFFEFAKFADYLDFSSAIFRKTAIFSNARIGLGNFKGAIFSEKADFGAARISVDLWFCAFVGDKAADAQFGAKANFTALVVSGIADFRGAKFNGGETSFNGARFEGEAFFRSDVVEKGDGTPGENLSVTTFAGKVDFTACRFEQGADFRGIICKKSICFNSIYVGGPALFRSEFAEPGAQLARTTFHDDADFTAAHFGGNAEFTGVRFRGHATFAGVRFDGFALFDSRLSRADGRPRLMTLFRNGASFDVAQFHSTATFVAALFGQRATFIEAAFHETVNFVVAKFRTSASFVGVCVKGQAIFCSAEPKLVTRFGGPVDFSQSDMAQADFRGARFKNLVSFKDGHIRGRADFGPEPFVAKRPTVFKRFADFSGIEIEEATEFDQAIFHGEVSFSGAKFGGKFSFAGVDFQSDKPKEEPTPAATRAAFIGCHFARKSNFSGTVFQTAISQRSCAAFDYSTFKEVADFGSAIFNNKATFRSSSFEGVEFSRYDAVQVGPRNEKQFKEKIDLRGSTYEHIETSWRDLLCDGDQSRMAEFDHQPYLQLEKTLREAGNDTAADAVYLEHRKRYRHKKWEDDRLAWFGDAAFFWLLTNYGVRPWRLIVIALVLLLGGVLCFQRLGAVELKPDEKAKTQASALPTPAASPEAKTAASSGKTTNNAKKLIKLDWKKATSVTVHQFIPIDIPLGSKWVPTRRSEFYATILKIAGAILVPLGIAIITGLMRRITR